MNRGLALIGALGLGAGVMYVLDPERGRRRRALMRDQAAHAFNKTGNAISTTSRDVQNRAHGIVAEVKSQFERRPVSDEVLVERLRSKMGRVVSHPHAIKVTADRGRVTLSGPILESEVHDLISCVSSVRGVKRVENRLEAHKQAADVPELQGGIARPGERFELLQTNWSPAARLFAGMAGGALALIGARQRSIVGATASALGIGLLARGLTNLEVKRLLGAGGGRQAITFQKTLNIAAPVERVFEYWSHYENFPHFMSKVREVRDIGNGRLHWVVAGPAGVPVEWDAGITKFVPNEVIAWKSLPGSMIENAGIVRFEKSPDGGTRIQIRLSYSPPAGAVGHTIATLLGANPKKQMDEDLVRMKTMIETGVAPHDAAQPAPVQRQASAR